jgi:hypothetical protein
MTPRSMVRVVVFGGQQTGITSLVDVFTSGLFPLVNKNQVLNCESEYFSEWNNKITSVDGKAPSRNEIRIRHTHVLLRKNDEAVPIKVGATTNTSYCKLQISPQIPIETWL